MGAPQYDEAPIGSEALFWVGVNNSAWQRGTNEHFNGRIRKYLPKRTSFADLDKVELDEIITEIIIEINNRPRKILGWATPAEVFNELCSQQATHTCCTSD